MKTKIFLILTLVFFVFSSCQNEGISSEDEINQARDPEGCETAFAYAKDGCFLDDDDENFKRWGWVIGPISAPYSETFDLYAAAGQCNLNKGEIVGSVSVMYMDDYVDVEFQVFGDWALFESHLYVGNAKYPTKPNGQNTVAPGKYGNKQSDPDGTDYMSYKIDDVSGELYIIAHAVVCPKKKK